MTPGNEDHALGRGLAIGHIAGMALLVSILFWWTGLRGWAEAQFGYLEVDALGVSPFLWVLLIGIGGLVLVTRLLPRRSAPGINVVCAVVALLAALVLAWVNLAYGAGDGISPAGWALGGLSLAQVAVLLVGLFFGDRRFG